jgi:hypothetical protein
MGGGGKKGGGGGAIDVDVTSTSNSVMDADTTANITSNSKTDLVSTSNTQLDSKAAAELQIAGLDNIRLKADTTADNKTQVEMDLKPLQVDFCFKVGLERFPSTKICKPIARHFGFTMFGVEVAGFNYSSDATTIIEDLGHRPFVVSDNLHFGHKPSHPGGGPGAQGIKIRLKD